MKKRIKSLAALALAILLVGGISPSVFGTELSSYQTGDVNNDGEIDTLDASLILQYDAKLITGF